MNKRITSLLLAVVMICSMLATAVPVFAAPGDSGVSASVTEASPGDTFTVTLTVPGTEKQISDIGVKVHFDSTVFEVTEYTIPSIAGMAKMQSNVAEANSNAFFSATYDSDSSDADITFTGLQLTATFKVKEGAAAGTYAFELDSTCKVGSLTDMGLPDILVKYEDFTSKSVSVTVTVPHTHVYDQTSTDAAHLKTPATCTEAAVYYKSCTCGENGEETFTSGSTLGHDYTKEVENNTYLKTAASNCTEYNVYWYACSRCDANAKDDAEATDKYYTSTTAGAHTEGTEWKFDENKHWHICTVAGCGVVIESSKEAHTPDREAATETDPIKCSVCDYIITPALGMQDYIVEMPVSIAVKLTGDEKPAKETFKFEIYDLGVEDAEFEIVKDSITVENIAFDENGVAFIEGIIKIKVTGEDQLCNLTEGFNVRMVKGSTKGWTYASEQWRIEPFFENDALDLKIAVKEIVDGEISEEYANGMSFSVSYEAVTEPETPKTGDSSMMVLWIALLFVSGVGVVGTTIYSRKKKYTVK